MVLKCLGRLSRGFGGFGGFGGGGGLFIQVLGYVCMYVYTLGNRGFLWF